MQIDKILWGLTTFFIIYLGLFYTKKLDFIQFRFKDMFRSLKGNKHNNEEISPFESLTMALAARIGVGSLAGVSLAIYKGGAGTIFWLILICFISVPTSFAETVLGIIYREKDNKNINRGGPAYYIKKGLGNKNLATVYALLIMISYVLGFLTIQANTITKLVTNKVTVSPIIIGLIISITTLVIIIGGVKKVAKTTSKLVPIMSIIYLTTALIIVLTNINKIPGILTTIINSAFNIKSFGWGVVSTFIIGVQRSIFSNEAGLGTGSIAAATSNISSPTKGGLIQMLGIYFTTIIVCGLTALVILTSNYDTLVLGDINGIEITNYAFNYHLGNYGNIILLTSIILFAYSTIITGYYYGESNLKLLLKKINNKHMKIFTIIVSILLTIGAISPSNLLWKFVDTLVAILGIINLYALYKLNKDVLNVWTYYKLKRYNISKEK